MHDDCVISMPDQPPQRSRAARETAHAYMRVHAIACMRQSLGSAWRGAHVPCGFVPSRTAPDR
jgi:hypothetical protein